MDAAAGPNQLSFSFFARREVEIETRLLEAVDCRGIKACEPKGSANRASCVILIATGVLNKDKGVLSKQKFGSQKGHFEGRAAKR
jgi:hypothetical protein